jgi:hypothetical protein
MNQSIRVSFKKYRIINLIKVLLSGFRNFGSRLFREEFLGILRNNKDTVSVTCTSYMYLQIRKHYSKSGLFTDLSLPKHSSLFGQIYGVKIYVDNKLERNELVLEILGELPWQQQKKRKKPQQQ